MKYKSLLCCFQESQTKKLKIIMLNLKKCNNSIHSIFSLEKLCAYSYKKFTLFIFFITISETTRIPFSFFKK